jgi:DUF2889 family protein
MSKLKQMISKAAVHSRVIDMKTYPVDEDSVIVEGHLGEERYISNYDLIGVEQPVGPFHQMAIRLLVRISTMEILDAEAEMDRVPLRECEETLESINDIIGLRISGGFVKRVRQQIGGAKGCAHLTHLLTVMSQAVFYGIVVIQRKEKTVLPGSLEEVPNLENLIDSCKMWGEGSVKLQGLKEALAKTARKGAGVILMGGAKKSRG